jgi:CNT family concentrative nucleoside transporter
MDYLRGFIGLAVIIGIAFFFSKSRSKVDWRLVVTGVAFQLVIAVLVLRVPVVRSGFEVVGAGFVKFLSFALNGAQFLFGDLAKNSDASPDVRHSLGFLFAFQALPTVIFFSAVTSGLYYLGILQRIVYVFAWIMAKTMRLSGAESLNAAGNIFLGQTEAPLLIKPFINKMTQSELHCVMVGGMATIAGSVMGAYVTFLGGTDPEQLVKFATYLLCASVMNAPAAIVMSKIFMPETEPEKIDRKVTVSKDTIGVKRGGCTGYWCSRWIETCREYRRDVVGVYRGDLRIELDPGRWNRCMDWIECVGTAIHEWCIYRVFSSVYFWSGIQGICICNGC